MPLVFYVLPYGNFDASFPNSWLPKYIASRSGSSEIPTDGFSLINQGHEGVCLIGVNGAVSTTHDPLAAKSDVIQIINEGGLDNVLTAGQATAVTNRLEALMIPGDWVQAGMTWRTVLRYVGAIFHFWQWMHMKGFADKLFAAGRDLDTRFRDLPAAMQTRIQAAATKHGHGNVPPGAKMRDILKAVFQQWDSGDPIKISGVDLSNGSPG